MRSAALVLTGVAALASEPLARPNLVFVIFDDLNTTGISSYGQHPDAKTPALDALAARGVRFLNAQTNAPICGPSRACLLTGQLPATSGYFGWNQQANHWRQNPALAKALTLMQAAKQNGYAVYGAGKIFHNGHAENSGFNSNGGNSSHAPFGNGGGNLNAGETTSLERYNAFGPLSLVPKGGWKGLRYVSETDRDLLPDERIAAWATKQVKDGAFKQPFLLMLGFNRPHQPEIAPTPYFDALPLDKVRLATAKDGDIDDLAPEFRQPKSMWTGSTNLGLWSRFSGGDGKNRQRYTQAYLACTTFADAQLGAVLDVFNASPYAANSVVMATSDHGWHLGEKERTFKNTPWEEACRVPFIVAGPGFAQGATCAQPIALVDVFPTCADLGGWKQVPKLDGHSLAPLCRDPAGGWTGGDAAITSIEPGWTKGKLPAPELRASMQNWSLRTARWRYIRGCLGGEELYDHDADPHEWTNLAGKPESAPVLAELRTKLMQMTGVQRWPDPKDVPLDNAANAAPGEHD